MSITINQVATWPAITSAGLIQSNKGTPAISATSPFNVHEEDERNLSITVTQNALDWASFNHNIAATSAITIAAGSYSANAYSGNAPTTLSGTITATTANDAGLIVGTGVLVESDSALGPGNIFSSSTLTLSGTTPVFNNGDTITIVETQDSLTIADNGNNVPVSSPQTGTAALLGPNVIFLGHETLTDEELAALPSDTVVISAGGALTGQTGTDRRDVMHANDDDFFLHGADGNDKLHASESGTLLSGGEGNDRLYGHDAMDGLYGYHGNDWLYGQAGNDALSGGEGNDKLYGGSGDDILYGGSGIDKLYGEDGADTFGFWYMTDGVDKIYDFDESEGDKLDISSILSPAYDPVTDAITDFVKITQRGNKTILWLDEDGGGDNFKQIARLFDANITTDVDALEESGTLVVELPFVSINLQPPEVVVSNISPPPDFSGLFGHENEYDPFLGGTPTIVL